MKRNLFVSFFLLSCLGIAHPLCAQVVKGRVIDLNGQAVSEVEVAMTATCGNRMLFPPTLQLASATTKSDGSGMFEWPYPVITANCGASAQATYTLKKTGFNFTNQGNFSLVLFGMAGSFAPIIDGRYSLVLAATTAIPLWAGVSAADYRANLVTNEMIVAGFGNDIATTTASASLPLPTTLANRRVIMRDANGKELPAQLLFVSPNQINFVAPTGLALGPCVIKLLDGNNNLLRVALPYLVPTSPGLFTYSADGNGVPAAIILRVKQGNVATFENLAQYDQTQKKWVPIAIDLGPSTDAVFLVLYGTGWRAWNLGTTVAVKLADVNCEVLYAGSQLVFAGLDQINARIPRSLIGRGDVNLSIEPGLGGYVWPLKIK
ncbi:MAG: hypothetical protein HOP19_13575 [Acidobacteria bacterium]|nr:hypothetical protein [Acidobacteriota bacterium]